MENYIMPFSAIRLSDIAAVGGKNASLGEMTVTLSGKGIRVPEGFALTTAAFHAFLDFNGLWDCFDQLQGLDRVDFKNLHQLGQDIRERMLTGVLPPAVTGQLLKAYRDLGGNSATAVAVRSSATAEDLPAASFAGQHESFLHISGENALLDAVCRCFASLFTDRAIKYREERGIVHKTVAISVGIQRMVDAGNGCSGVIFTLEPESGNKEIILVSGVWGLGENIVQGTVEPDEFYLFKPALYLNKKAIFQHKTGRKETILRYAPNALPGELERIATPVELQAKPVLDENEIQTLATWSLEIEQHYKCPMDIEWAKDGQSGSLYILQARPETVHTHAVAADEVEYRLTGTGKLLVQGEAIGNRIATGRARLLKSPLEAGSLHPGDIIVTANTTPDWDPLLKKAGGIVTDSGGRTSHAAIVARETGIPAVVGTGNATTLITDGSPITISCSEGKAGRVYAGTLPFETIRRAETLQHSPQHTKVMLILSDPDQAFRLAVRPSDGVGLLRMEFIITHTVKVHPMALVRYDSLTDGNVKAAIAKMTEGYADKTQYFVDRLASGIATVAAAFYPREVIVRMSDFKTNEYAQLLGGQAFEPKEENPMLGFRGASRYYHPLYREGFALECRAVKMVRDEMGLTNVKIMIPFCRTVNEGKKVMDVMRESGLVRAVNGLETYVMAEIPSNVVDAARFAEIFDGFSIGSNDLTQLVLGVDRDSAILSKVYSEDDHACKYMVAEMIRHAHEAGVPVGFCGQAPSDLPDYAAFLVANGITGISFTPDAFYTGRKKVYEAELKLKLPAFAGGPGKAR
ncbi:phosphoenolpyruvate synthase [Chitinophaga rhizosphaerae]|uniref:phosphoenolpyruvate synthase n=1 Tax=Chitinophaga rhizosphaerae TaxID=1864947 RepID=UPI000F80384A|nr:phosphoenolpyruvate synthase [Chitinophaga rhizosphaerae]